MYNICFNCMNLLEGSPVCLNCGFDNSNVTASAPYHLKPGTILAERYLVGKALGEGGKQIKTVIRRGYKIEDQ